MRAVVQRVRSADVTVEDVRVGSVGKGLLVYLGVEQDDGADDVDYIVQKLRFLRIFSDADGKMNLDIKQAGGNVLVVSAFTLQGDARKGRRPTFERAARPEQARALYEQVSTELKSRGLVVEQGVFGAHMDVQSVNDGPVCILLDSRRGF